MPDVVALVSGVTLRLLAKADLPLGLNAPPLWQATAEQAQSSPGNTGDKAPTPSEGLHSPWSWI